MVEVILLPADDGKALEHHYRRALDQAVELHLVSAYLTEWDPPAELNGQCRILTFVVGKDFGITRKEACRRVLRWLPASHKNAFLVAERIDGFHPKSLIWREADNSCHALVGSSNLSRAAFSTNHEANVYVSLEKGQFQQFQSWVKGIRDLCDPVDEDWINAYAEAPRRPKPSADEKKAAFKLMRKLDLPRPTGARKQVAQRRTQLAQYKKHSSALYNLFKACATGKISSDQFYEELPKYWSWSPTIRDRLQGAGWERQGKNSDFSTLSQSFVRMVEANEHERDAVVRAEIDRLKAKNVPARTAFLSEMLCLRFPGLYPVVNKPVKAYLKAIRYRRPRGATEGAAYLALSEHLRRALRENPGHPAKNIAELDAVIWLAYGK